MMGSMKGYALLASAAIAVLAAGSASAQLATGDQAIEIKATQGEYLQNEGRGVYLGNVVATQGDNRIMTDKLTVICRKSVVPAGSNDKPVCEATEQLIAEGNVYYIAADVKIRGDRAQYDYAADTITITGEVIMSRGTEGVIKGTQVVYSVSEGRTKVTAGAERVTTVLTPAKKGDAPTNTAPPATPPAAPPAKPN
jgi:lipopolysaccharide export system protein LptA